MLLEKAWKVIRAMQGRINLLVMPPQQGSFAAAVEMLLMVTFSEQLCIFKNLMATIDKSNQH